MRLSANFQLTDFSGSPSVEYGTFYYTSKCILLISMTNNSLISYRTLWWQLVVLGSIPGRSKRYFTLSKCPDWLWGQHSLLFKGYKGFFLCVQSGQGRKLTIHLHLVLRFRMNEAASLLFLFACTACNRTTLPSESPPMLEGYLLFSVYKCLTASVV